MINPDDNPMQHPEEPPSGSGDSPRFGLLLIVLALAVIMIGILTFAGEAYFS
ncbi:MAG: hypothetical protein H7327_15710 [Herminiimonas sp.]|nr:hypothetical protein [Herminiimonas sp.]